MGIWTTDDKGHAVVIDGYRSDSLYHFHVNLGWGGSSDAWYNLPDMPAGGYSFSTVQALVFDIAPFAGWPQWGSDGRNSFRSPYTIPLQNRPTWRVQCSSDETFEGVVVGKGKTLFAAMSQRSLSSASDAGVWVISQFGVLQKQIVLTGEKRASPPAQNSEGAVFVGTRSGGIYRIDPESLSAARVFSEPSGRSISAPLKIDEDDNIYFQTSSRVYSLNDAGLLRWSFAAPGGAIVKGVAIDRSRNRVYLLYQDFGSTTATLICLNRFTGEVVTQRVWSAPAGASSLPATRPAITADGTVFIGIGETLYGLDPDATLTERYMLNVSPGNATAPAIGRDGTLYFAHAELVDGSYVARLTAWVPGASQTKWFFRIPGLNPAAGDSIRDLYATQEGIVFSVEKFNPDGSDTYDLHAFRDDGDHASFLWKNSNSSGGGSKAAFGPGPAIYVVTGPFGDTIQAISDGGLDYVNNRAPLAPDQPTPIDDATGVSTSPTISWRCSDPDGNALKYTVLLCDLSADNPLMKPISTGLTSTNLSLSALKADCPYVWRVIASDGLATTEGPDWSFRTAPPVPLFIYPPTRNGNTLSVRWQGGGRLQWAPTVRGSSWTDVSSSSPASVTVPLGATRFFRVVKP